MNTNDIFDVFHLNPRGITNLTYFLAFVLPLKFLPLVFWKFHFILSRVLPP